MGAPDKMAPIVQIRSPGQSNCDKVAKWMKDGEIYAKINLYDEV